MTDQKIAHKKGETRQGPALIARPWHVPTADHLQEAGQALRHE